MRLCQQPAFCALLTVLAGAALAENTETTTTSTSTMPCTATATSGAYYDLRPDIAIAPEEGVTPKHGVHTTDYLARGFDYGANFTLNICGAVVKSVKDVDGVDSKVWRNVSAYYRSGSNIYSLGQESSELKIRGRKLVLQYTGGSPCGKSTKKNEKRSDSVHNGAAYKTYSDEEDEGKASASKDEKSDKTRRKSATISFLCDRDPLYEKLTLSFVGADPDECAYFFEVRSKNACAGAEPHKPGSVGPGSVFTIILLIAVLVYVVGGIFYQRTVSHARGWRQLPNYSLWAGIWNFVSDIFVILTASCTRFFPSRRGYSALSSSANGRRDDENRLIDQLDEEWDD